MPFNKEAAKAKFAEIKKGAAPAVTEAAAPKPRGRGRPPKEAAPVVDAAPEASDAHSITLPGEHGPVVISGDARDVLSHVQGYLHN